MIHSTLFTFFFKADFANNRTRRMPRDVPNNQNHQGMNNGHVGGRRSPPGNHQQRNNTPNLPLR